jgi:hypothetical protein
MRDLLARLVRTDPLLMGTALAQLLLLVLALAGLWLDPRIVTGAPAWLKPTKFALSTAIYMVTLTWVFTYLPNWPRVRRFTSRGTALVFIGEVGIIDLQAWRGTTSHFNVATPLDATLFAVMGIGILIQTVASGVVAVALWRQHFADRGIGWALRWGATLSILGALVGGLMTRPTEPQLAEARLSHRLPIAGAHTVGAPDGGPGWPVTGWSTVHGDLRVPHFVGLHALQLLPFLAFLLRHRRESARVGLIHGAAAAYGLLFAWLLAQALAGHPVLPPRIG